MIAPCEECISLAICKGRGMLLCEDLFNFIHNQESESEIDKTWDWLNEQYLRGRKTKILIKHPSKYSHIIYRLS